MKTGKITFTTIATTLAFAGTLFATDEATAGTLAENADAITDTLKTLANFLPFPWNVIGASIIAAAASVFAYRVSKKKANEK